MKKIITLALVLIVLATTAFSNVPITIAPKVLTNFNQTFIDAKEVKWESVNGYSKATFKLEGKQMFAYYNEEGEEVALTRNLVADQLPTALYNQLKSKFTSQWVTELFEISSNGETSFFATLYSADQITVLKADLAGNWRVFRKTRRDAL